MKKILLVEDNDKYRNLVKDVLIMNNYDVVDVDNPITGLEKLAKVQFNLAIIDLRLPTLNGIQLSESIKRIDNDIPIIILTGDPDEATQKASLDYNVEAYLSKESSTSLILKYVEHIIEKYESKTNIQKVLTSDAEGIELFVQEHIVLKRGKLVELTQKEFLVLKYFLSNKNVIVTREEFLTNVWEEDLNLLDVRLVDTHIKNLRDKLNSFSISTIRGLGYRWNEIDEI